MVGFCLFVFKTNGALSIRSQRHITIVTKALDTFQIPILVSTSHVTVSKLSTSQENIGLYSPLKLL